MRVRKYPLGAFIGLNLVAAYLGLAPSTIPSYGQSDKFLHFITFLLITTSFYWILETNRRKNLHLTVFVCTVVLGLGSEVVQGLLPNGRDFDLYDILANVLGSLSGVGISTWYHKRMLERKRSAKYSSVPGEEDVELGESGLVEGGQPGAGPSLEEEVDNWDENEQDWDDDEPTAAEEEPVKPQSIEDTSTDDVKKARDE